MNVELMVLRLKELAATPQENVQEREALVEFLGRVVNDESLGLTQDLIDEIKTLIAQW